MWKFTILLAFFTLTTAQDDSITLNCIFSTSVYNDYICRLEQIEVLNENQSIVVAGEHLANRTDDDVNIVQIRNSNTPFMIQEIFSSFPNIVQLDIQGSNLQSINIPDSIQLEMLILSRNNISRIANGTFAGQSKLEYISASEAGIEEIEEDALVGLESLTSLILIANKISSLTPRTLSPLVNIVRIDLERNLLTRVDDIFMSNTNLTYLYLEFNQINEISPTFIQSISNLSIVNLRGNQCIDRYFTFNNNMEIVIFNNLLAPCFNNFIGEVPETRRITLEFSGPLALFDEFGNIIARVN